MKYLILIISALMLVSCASENKLRKKAKAFYQTHPAELAELCNDEFPIPEVEVIPGKEIIKEVIKEVPGEVIPCPEPTPENPNPSVQCPPSKTIVKEVSRTDTIKIKDTRELYIYKTRLDTANSTVDNLKSEKETLNEQIRKLKNDRNNWRWIAVVVILCGGLFVMFKALK